MTVKKENSQRNVTGLLFTYQDVTKPFLTIEMILENLDSNERACQSLLARDIKWSFQIGCTLMEKCIFEKKLRFFIEIRFFEEKMRFCLDIIHFFRKT